MASAGGRGRTRRILYRLGIAAGVVLVVLGAVIGYAGYEHTAGPDGAVRGYFSALAAGDAPRALAWGDLPSGPHTLLTSDVLALQQRLAPLRDLRITSVTRSGSRATVHVRYELRFPSGAVPVTASVPVEQRDGDWRLRATAVSTQLLLDEAARRMTVLGTAVPTGTALVFPGAVPITLDTPMLELDASQDVVGFGSGPLVDVTAEVSRSGRTAVQQAVGARLRQCLAGRGDATCPLPDPRYAPGSLRGTVTTRTLDNLTVTLGSGPDGAIEVSGRVTMAGTWRRLTFANVARPGKGQVALDVHGFAYATTPLTIVWTQS